MGEYFEGVFYEERALSYMALTLVCGSVITTSMFFLVLFHRHKLIDKRETAMCLLYCSLFAFALGLGLWKGYSSPNHHGKTKEEIATYDEAVAWNNEEHKYNSLIFRFTLRNEDLVDLGEFEDVQVSD